MFISHEERASLQENRSTEHRLGVTMSQFVSFPVMGMLVAYCPGGDPEAGCLEAAQFQTDVSSSLWLSCTGGMMLLHGTECNERLHQSFHSVHTYTS